MEIPAARMVATPPAAATPSGITTPPDRAGSQLIRAYAMDFSLKTASSAQWLDAVMTDFDAFLRDHASCEKKASGMAMSIISHYPDKPLLIREMLNLALEELSHYREVMRLILDRNLRPGRDEKDDYINNLNQLLDRGREHYLMDRLLLASIVEARGAERFGLIADALQDPQLQRFYQSITDSENRHYQRFLELAATYFEVADIGPRLDCLLTEEAAILQALPVRARLH